MNLWKILLGGKEPPGTEIPDSQPPTESPISKLSLTKDSPEHKIGPKGVCIICGCSETGIRNFGWECKRPETTSPTAMPKPGHRCSHCGRVYAERQIKQALDQTNPVFGMFKNVVVGTIRWHCECGQINAVGLKESPIDEIAETLHQTLQHAVRKDDLETVKTLLEENLDLVFKKNNIGLTPLHEAADYGHKDVAKLLLARNAEVNARTNESATPLHYAADAGHKDVAELLLVHGAEVNAKTDAGWTPLHQAAKNGSKDMAQLLLVHGAKINAMGNDCETPLHVAAAKDNISVAELLLANKGDVNAKNNKGYSPLHLAADKQSRIMAELLLSNGAAVNAKDGHGETPLHDAVRSQRRDVAELLRQHGGHE
jgi:ankyrin repeat protein